VAGLIDWVFSQKLMIRDGSVFIHFFGWYGVVFSGSLAICNG
jgi:uncharacterized membrane protein YedE/YeeE